MSHDDPSHLEDQSLSQDKLLRLDEDEAAERKRRWFITIVIFILGCAVALWVGFLISASQDDAKKSDTTATKARAQADQSQAEKFTLAQQVAAACAGGTLDKEVATQLCHDAAQITKEGPRGIQGIPGIQGIQGVQGAQGEPGRDGVDGKDGPAGKDGATGPAGPPGQDGKDGATGPAGPPGQDGKDGAVGPAGPAGADGEPPFSWVVYNEAGNEIQRCERTADFDPDAPTYTCTNTQGPPPAVP